MLQADRMRKKRKTVWKGGDIHLLTDNQPARGVAGLNVHDEKKRLSLAKFCGFPMLLSSLLSILQGRLFFASLLSVPTILPEWKTGQFYKQLALPPRRGNFHSRLTQPITLTLLTFVSLITLHNIYLRTPLNCYMLTLVSLTITIC